MTEYTVETKGGQRLHVKAEDAAHARRKARRQLRKLGRVVDVTNMVVLFGWCGTETSDAS